MIETEFAEVVGRGYLNAASIGPMPASAVAAVDRVGQLRARVHTMKNDDFVGPTRRAREACARLINAEPGEIALGPNTSFGINLAALGLAVPHGSVVLLPDREFPANVYPWMHRDRLDVERVPTDENGWPDVPRLLERVRDPRVAILAISSVQFDNGYRADLDLLGAACRESNTYLVVDAIQSLGCLPLDVRRTPIDVLAAGGHKWLCGPLGSGFAYVRREVQQRLEPVVIGWTAMKTSLDLSAVLDYDWSFLPDARRYEVGTAALQDQAGLAAAIEVLLDVGIGRIAAHVDALLQPIRDWAAGVDEVGAPTAADPMHRSGILALELPNSASAYRALRAANITSSVRQGAVRFAPHIYNSMTESERVVEVLEGERRRGWR